MPLPPPQKKVLLHLLCFLLCPLLFPSMRPVAGNKAEFKQRQPSDKSTTMCAPSAGASACSACTSPPLNGTFLQTTSDTTRDACPWVCNSGFYPPPADVGGSPPAACLPCTDAPPGAVYTGPGAMGGGGACPWQCGPGYFRALDPQEQCAPCPTGTFSPATGAYLHSHKNQI